MGGVDTNLLFDCGSTKELIRVVALKAQPGLVTSLATACKGADLSDRFFGLRTGRLGRSVIRRETIWVGWRSAAVVVGLKLSLNDLT